MTAGGDNKPVDLAALGAALPGRPNLTDEDRAGLMSAIQDKLDSLAAGALEALSPAVKARVLALQELQKSHNELHGKFLEEKAALEKKYQQLYQPLYSQRFDIVNGVVDPAAGEEAAAEGAEVEKGVPEFWLTAMKNNDILVEQITARDEGALKHLRDITWAPLEGDAKGFKLIFHFDTNPYFSNATLTKSYFMIDEEEPILEKAEGTEISWLAGKNLTVKVLKKKPKKGAGKNAKPITKTEPCESFFNFFSPPSVPTEEEELEEEEAEELQELMEQDYDIGSTLKEKIIPQAVSWYTGEAAELEDEYDEDDEDDDEEDEEGEDDEEDDEDEDEEDDDDDDDGKQGKKSKSPATKKVRKKAAGAGAAGAAGEQPAECKQQ